MTEKNLSEFKYLNKEIALCRSKLCTLEAYKNHADESQKQTIDALQLKISFQMSEFFRLYDEINDFISSIDDPLLRLIISLRFINGLSWDQIAAHIGGQNNADSVRKAYSRYARKHLKSENFDN